MPTDGRQTDEQTETNLPRNYVCGGYTCIYTLQLLIFTSSSKVHIFIAIKDVLELNCYGISNKCSLCDQIYSISSTERTHLYFD